MTSVWWNGFIVAEMRNDFFFGRNNHEKSIHRKWICQAISKMNERQHFTSSYLKTVLILSHKYSQKSVFYCFAVSLREEKKRKPTRSHKRQIKTVDKLNCVEFQFPHIQPSTLRREKSILHVKCIYFDWVDCISEISFGYLVCVVLKSRKNSIELLKWKINEREEKNPHTHTRKHILITHTYV